LRENIREMQDSLAPGRSGIRFDRKTEARLLTCAEWPSLARESLGLSLTVDQKPQSSKEEPAREEFS
jgi:hypothetical protein